MAYNEAHYPNLGHLKAALEQTNSKIIDLATLVVGALEEMVIQTDMTIPISAWVENADIESKSKGYEYSADVMISGLSEDAIVNTVLDISCLKEAENAGIAPTTWISDGKVQFYAKNIPTEIITGGMTIMLGYVSMGDMSATVYDPIGGARQVAFANDMDVLSQIADRIYQGIDLTAKFADEIAAAPYSGDAWAWIKGRIQAGNYAGIHVFDWIPFTADGHDYQAQIAGINTCTGYGDTPTGNHIDFITKELWHTKRAMNLVDLNTGCETQKCEWMIADLKYYLNSEAGDTLTDRTARTTGPVDYTNSGVYRLLPTELKNVIIEKRVNLPGRWQSFTAATEPSVIQWESIGRLWLPTEYEVLGMDSIRSTNTLVLGSYIAQYPIFAGTAGSRLKKLGTQACAWWLMSATRNSQNFTAILDNAAPGYFPASSSDVGFPICFRVG